MPVKNHKVDIFKVLGQISKGDRDFYTNMPDEDKKAIHPLVLMKWMSGTKSERQIMFLNMFANKHIFSLSNHPNLLMDLLVVCGPGRSTRYNWTKKKANESKYPKLVELVKDSYECSSMRAEEDLPLLSNDDLLEMAVQLGRQSQEVKDIKKEIKKRNL